MKLIDGWRRKWPQLWSVRLALLAAILSAVEVAFSLVLDGRAPWIVLGAFALSLAAAIARAVAQPGLRNDEDRG